jgi:hypothetical protein
MMTFITALGLVPMLIMRNYKGRMDQLISGILDRLQNMNWFILFPLVLALYVGSMFLAVKIREHRSAEHL